GENQETVGTDLLLVFPRGSSWWWGLWGRRFSEAVYETLCSFLFSCWLKELLRAKLIECGWRDQLKAHCKEVIKEKGIENVTVEDLVAGVTPKGRALVPDSVKKELLQRIRAFLAQHST
uniref:Transcription and mRNA export factor ENY2 n=1 Tax=Astyanax mexicanus TaxID=7994 RepID=A0A3B1IJ78_ASTMX